MFIERQNQVLNARGFVKFEDSDPNNPNPYECKWEGIMNHPSLPGHPPLHVRPDLRVDANDNYAHRPEDPKNISMPAYTPVYQRSLQ